METPRNKGDATVSRDRAGTSKNEGIEMDFSYRRKSLTGPRTHGTWRSQITPPYRYLPIMTNPLTTADGNRWQKGVLRNQQEKGATTRAREGKRKDLSRKIT